VKRFGYLAGEPSCGGMLGDGRVNDPPPTVGQNDRQVEQLKRHRCHNEHIDRSNAGGVVEQKAAPGRRGCTSSSHHVFGDRSLADLDAEPEQFTMDRRRVPERGGRCSSHGLASELRDPRTAVTDLERQRQ
jgi:hypothetical protein